MGGPGGRGGGAPLGPPPPPPPRLQSYRSPQKPAEELGGDDMATVINDGLAYYEQELRKVGRGGQGQKAAEGGRGAGV